MKFDIRQHFDKLTPKAGGTKGSPKFECPFCPEGSLKVNMKSGKYNTFNCKCLDDPNKRKELVKTLQPFPDQNKKIEEPPKPQEWEYTAQQGFSIKVKKYYQGNSKQFSQQHKAATDSIWKNGLPNGWTDNQNWGKVDLYRNDLIDKAKETNEPLFYCEGEKTADALIEIGLLAATNLQGSSKWCKAWAEKLKGVNVVLCPDRDGTGVAHMMRIKSTIEGLAKSISWCLMPPSDYWWQNLPKSNGLDAYDYLRRQTTKPTKDLILGLVQGDFSLVTSQPEKDPLTTEQETDYLNLPYGDLIKKVELIYSSNAESPGRLRYDLLRLAQKTKISLDNITFFYHQAKRNKDGGHLTGREFLNLKVPDIDWLVGGLLPKGKLILFSADGGAGKSTFLYHLANCVRLGHPFSGRLTNRGNVLFLQSDEGMQTAKSRLQRLGFFDDNVDDWGISFTDDFSNLTRLEKLIEKHNYQLIICDSLTKLNRHCGFAQTEIGYGNTLIELAEIRDRLGCTIVIIHHFNQRGLIRGSSTIGENVDEQWGLKIEGDGKRIFSHAKSRSDLYGESIVAFDEETGQISLEPIEEPDFSSPKKTIAKNNSARIIGFLRKNCGVFYSRRELFEQFNESIPDTSLRRSLKNLTDKDGVVKKISVDVATTGGMQSVTMFGVPMADNSEKITIYRGGKCETVGTPCGQNPVAQGLQGGAKGGAERVAKGGANFSDPPLEAEKTNQSPKGESDEVIPPLAPPSDPPFGTPSNPDISTKNQRGDHFSSQGGVYKHSKNQQNSPKVNDHRCLGASGAALSLGQRIFNPIVYRWGSIAEIVEDGKMVNVRWEDTGDLHDVPLKAELFFTEQEAQEMNQNRS